MIDWLRRRVGRWPASALLIEPLRERRELGPRDRGLTAREAYALAEPEAAALDPSARPFLIACPDIQPDGRGRLWEIGFSLPSRLATAIVGLTVELDEAGDPARLALALDVQPAVKPGSLLDQAIRRANLGARGVQEIWRTIQPGPDLPLPFRDSPEAVRAMGEQGVDLLSGPTDLPLSARVLEDGEAVWEMALRFTTCHAPFRATPDD